MSAVVNDIDIEKQIQTIINELPETKHTQFWGMLDKITTPSDTENQDKSPDKQQEQTPEMLQKCLENLKVIQKNKKLFDINTAIFAITAAKNDITIVEKASDVGQESGYEVTITQLETAKKQLDSPSFFFTNPWVQFLKEATQYQRFAKDGNKFTKAENVTRVALALGSNLDANTLETIKDSELVAGESLTPDQIKSLSECVKQIKNDSILKSSLSYRISRGNFGRNYLKNLLGVESDSLDNLKALFTSLNDKLDNKMLEYILHSPAAAKEIAAHGKELGNIFSSMIALGMPIEGNRKPIIGNGEKLNTTKIKNLETVLGKLEKKGKGTSPNQKSKYALGNQSLRTLAAHAEKITDDQAEGLATCVGIFHEKGFPLSAIIDTDIGSGRAQFGVNRLALLLKKENKTNLKEIGNMLEALNKGKKNETKKESALGRGTLLHIINNLDEIGPKADKLASIFGKMTEKGISLKGHRKNLLSMNEGKLEILSQVLSNNQFPKSLSSSEFEILYKNIQSQSTDNKKSEYSGAIASCINIMKKQKISIAPSMLSTSTSYLKKLLKLSPEKVAAVSKIMTSLGKEIDTKNLDLIVKNISSKDDETAKAKAESIEKVVASLNAANIPLKSIKRHLIKSNATQLSFFQTVFDDSNIRMSRSAIGARAILENVSPLVPNDDDEKQAHLNNFKEAYKISNTLGLTAAKESGIYPFKKVTGTLAELSKMSPKTLENALEKLKDIKKGTRTPEEKKEEAKKYLALMGQGKDNTLLVAETYKGLGDIKLTLEEIEMLAKCENGEMDVEKAEELAKTMSYLKKAGVSLTLDDDEKRQLEKEKTIATAVAAGGISAGVITAYVMGIAAIATLPILPLSLGLALGALALGAFAYFTNKYFSNQEKEKSTINQLSKLETKDLKEINQALVELTEGEQSIPLDKKGVIALIENKKGLCKSTDSTFASTDITKIDLINRLTKIANIDSTMQSLSDWQGVTKLNSPDKRKLLNLIIDKVESNKMKLTQSELQALITNLEHNTPNAETLIENIKILKDLNIKIDESYGFFGTTTYIAELAKMSQKKLNECHKHLATVAAAGDMHPDVQKELVKEILKRTPSVDQTKIITSRFEELMTAIATHPGDATHILAIYKNKQSPANQTYNEHLSMNQKLLEDLAKIKNLPKNLLKQIHAMIHTFSFEPGKSNQEIAVTKSFVEQLKKELEIINKANQESQDEEITEVASIVLNDTQVDGNNYELEDESYNADYGSDHEHDEEHNNDSHINQVIVELNNLLPEEPDASSIYSRTNSDSLSPVETTVSTSEHSGSHSAEEEEEKEEEEEGNVMTVQSTL